MSETVDITIRADATWQESLWLLDGHRPVDLTAKHVELRVMPAFNYPGEALAVLSDITGEITIDNATKGAITIAMTQDQVEADLPPGDWDYYLRVLNGPADTIEYRRGKLFVLAGRT